MAGPGSRGGPKKKVIDWALAEKMLRRGFTEEETSKSLGIDWKTWKRRKKSNPELCPPIKDWKDEWDDKVELSNAENACGVIVWEDRIVGFEDGEPKIVRIHKKLAPNPTAAIFWLKNRRPTKWRDKQDHELTLNKETLASIINQLPAGLADAVRGKLTEGLPEKGNR